MLVEIRRSGGSSVVVFALTILFLLSSLAGAAPWTSAGAPERRIIVFENWFSDGARQAALVRAFGGDAVRSLALVNAQAAALPPGIEKQLARRAEVLRIDVDAEVRALGKPAIPPGLDKKDPPEQPAQVLPWGVDRIDAEYAWGTSGGAGIAVAVLDTGIDRDHPDLAANIAGGVNFVSKPPWKPVDPSKWDDDNGHGTHVAGIIAALDNDIGVIGVAPEADLYALKVLDKTGSGYISQIITGLEWCADNGIDIANMSLGTDADIQSFEDACDAAEAAGVILVAAAGNDGADVDYPGAYDSVLAVAATDAADAVPWWSSPGSAVSIAGPGVSVYSTWKDDGYDTKSGTSMAAPHITGTLALALAAGVSTSLCATADDLPPPGIDVYTGCGLVDAEEAVTGTAANGDDLP